MNEYVVFELFMSLLVSMAMYTILGIAIGAPLLEWFGDTKQLESYKKSILIAWRLMILFIVLGTISFALGI